MLISLDLIAARHDISMIRGVLHLGAHLGEEAPDYHRMGWRPVHWVEANAYLEPKLKRAVEQFPENHVHIACMAEESGHDAAFNVASNGQSSSLLPFGTHQQSYPNITYEAVQRVKTTSLSDLAQRLELPHNINFLNLDLQGVELAVLRGGVAFLSQVHMIYAEVNEAHLYQGCELLPAMDAFLLTQGFSRHDTVFTSAGWGDALYVRDK